MIEGLKSKIVKKNSGDYLTQSEADDLFKSKERLMEIEDQLGGLKQSQKLLQEVEINKIELVSHPTYSLTFSNLF